MAEQDFIDRIIEGFLTLRERPHLDVVAAQFAAGEIVFVVDHHGIRTVLPDDAGSDTDPGVFS